MSNYQNYEQINRISKTDFLSKVFAYLGLGLLLSAVGALFGSYILPMTGSLYVFVIIISAIAELVLAFVIGRNLEGRSTASVRTMFVIYSLINGITLSLVLDVYTGASVLMAFVTAAIVFISLCVIGRTTKVDLSRFGSLLMIGLVVCIIVSLANLFIFRASGLEIALCYIETLLFMGIIAYDMQMIDRYYAQSENENYAIFAALQLELDFINLLIRILEIFGVRKDD